ncbi:MAG: glutathione S-transferase [Rhodocyclaceae bacterium]|nr:glutathione S-transferase [Rhodocyclaceae bacterium]
MLLYDYHPAPSPRRVRIFLAEKTLSVPIRAVDLAKREQLADDYRAKNPRCTVPMLELDDGSCLWDTLAICEYIESLQPSPPLFGRSALDHARVVMWYQRIELDGFLATADVFRNANPAFKDRALFGPLPTAQIPALIERSRPRVRQFYLDMDARLAASEYVAGDFFSLADIQLLCVVDFAMGWGRMPLPAECAALAAWHAKVGARPSASA